MRHLNGGFKLGRNPSHRRAVLRNLTGSLIEKDRIQTTLTKAKAVKPIVERMITLAKSSTLANKRRAFAFLYRRKTVHMLFSDVAPRFMDRNGGYTRIIRTDAFRKGDGAEMAILEFVDHQFVIKQKKSKDKAKVKAKK